MAAKKNIPVDIRSEIKTIAEGLGVDSDKAVELAQKCYDDIVWRPYGGATSFREIDEAKMAQDYSYRVDDETYKLRAIIENITEVEDLGLDDKVSAIQAATNDYKTRVGSLRVIPEDLNNKSVLDRIKNLLWPAKPEPVEMVKTGGFKVFKDKDGNYRWLSLSSNAFEDLDKELFTTEALKEAVEYADESGERGPLLLYHVPSAEVGHCDYQTLAGRFLLESGTFDDTPLGAKALEYFTNSDEDFQVSIGYQYNDGDEEDGQYDWLRIKERSVTPFGAAANPWTDFKVIGGKELDTNKQEWLEKVFGKEQASLVIAAVETKSKELEDSGTRFKEKTEGDTTVVVTATGTPEGEIKKVDEVVVTTEETKEEAPALNMQELATLLVTMNNSIETIAGSLKSVTDEVKALQKTDDEKIAAMVSPRYSGGNGQRPSEDNKNLIGDPEGFKASVGETEQPVNPVQKYVDDLLQGRGIIVQS